MWWPCDGPARYRGRGGGCGVRCRCVQCSVLPGDGELVFAARVSGSAPGAQVGGTRSALAQLVVKGRAPKTGYAHSEFGVAWTDANTVTWGGNSLSTREDILSRDLLGVLCKGRSGVAPPVHVPQSGVLRDRYTEPR